MDWFRGDIADAVRISKEKNIIFLVFINGNTEEAQHFAELVNSEAIVRRISDNSRYLAIHIESGTDTYTQFAQIYRVVPVPSLFFIGEFGQPIEIVTNIVKSVDALHERLNVAEGIFYKKSSRSAEQSSGSKLEGDGSVAKSPDSAKTPEKKTPPLKSKKSSGDDLDLQKLKEDRKREKAEAEEARRRVLEQIKLDRLRRQDHEPIINAKLPSTAAETAPTPVRHHPDSTRIQFRKPNGESVVESFKTEGPFGDVWKYAKANLGVTDFILATAVPPRKEFSVESSEKTLFELELVHSAVLLVIPLQKPSRIGEAVSNRGGVVATVSGFFFTVFWALMTPILAMWSRIIGNTANPPSHTDSNSSDATVLASGTSIASEVSQKRNLARYNLSPSGNEKRSNVHGLRDLEEDDDDDDKNTYNGNSTQQM